MYRSCYCFYNLKVVFYIFGDFVYFFLNGLRMFDKIAMNDQFLNDNKLNIINEVNIMKHGPRTKFLVKENCSEVFHNG